MVALNKLGTLNLRDREDRFMYSSELSTFCISCRLVARINSYRLVILYNLLIITIDNYYISF